MNQSLLKKLYLEELLIILILTLQIIIVCLGVLSRYFFNWSLSFTEEIPRFLLVYLACLGFSACLARQELIRFQLPWNKSPRTERFLTLIYFLANGIFFMILFSSSLKMIYFQWKFSTTTSVLGISVIWLSICLPITALLFLYRMFSACRQPKPEHPVSEI